MKNLTEATIELKKASHYLGDKWKAIERTLMIQGAHLELSKSFDSGKQTFSKYELSKFITNEYPTHRLVVFMP